MDLPQEVELLGPDFTCVGEELVLVVVGNHSQGVVVVDCPIRFVSNLHSFVFLMLGVDVDIRKVQHAFIDVLFSVNDDSTTAFVSLSDCLITTVFSFLSC